MVPEKTECPVCGISVKPENLEKHVKKVHPGKEVELPKVKKKAKRAKGIPVGRAWPKWVALIVVLIVIVVVAAVFLLPGEESPPGNYAPDFNVVDVDGNPYSLSSRIGPHPILIEFFLTGGTPCRDMALVLNDLSDYYGNSLEIVSLSRDSVVDIRQFRDAFQNDWTFAQIGNDVYESYGSPGHPHFVVVDKKGIMRSEMTGVQSLQELKNAIEPWI